MYFTIGEQEDEFYREARIFMVTDLLREMILFTSNWSKGISKKHKAAYSFMKAIKDILPTQKIQIANFPIHILILQIRDY
ncbi:hypothetical protein [Elizabethkingia sp. JS20170427COW]|uniref:hypothetical protein n=1 Tax=Elizabethkingia sp. JS20170427COW TaxID=2583851 RepID=UPI001110B563|nr:hypothetical protein [Elizabethkingia sp. JS20170427COW]QCX53641.1 hypothetical protein FGE20_07805 [Elizabethkingia sp. JS20170427COW]